MPPPLQLCHKQWTLGQLLVLLLAAAICVTAQPLDPDQWTSLLPPDAAAGNSTTLRADAAVPDLLGNNVNGAQKAQWLKLGQYMWDFLAVNDHDFYDAEGRVVPSTYRNISRVQSGVQCGRSSRQWIRMTFHDCGTYSRFLRAYGCNGSLRKELPSTEPWLNYTKPTADGKKFEVISPDVFDQFRTDGVLHPRVDPGFTPGEHLENTGLAASIAALYGARLYAESPAVGLSNVSLADILVYAGSIALARCEGPHVLFEPQRRDADMADPDDMLPKAPPEDNFHHILQYFLQQGLSQLDGVVLLASHTTACFAEGCLDSTPHKFDKVWAQEVLANSSDLPVCAPLNQTASVPQCRAPMDTVWLEHNETRRFLELMVSPVNNLVALQTVVAGALTDMQLDNYEGLRPGVNLCTPASCPSYRDNYAFFNLFATSWHRLGTHNIPTVV